MRAKISARLVCAFFLLSILASALFVAAAAASTHSGGYSELSRSVYIDEILETCVDDIALSEAEKEYLRLRGGLLKTYSLNVPTYAVKTEYDNGILTVTANE